ncbi:MAG TPA: PH domain-containing protein [Mycobacterium sp.]|uniref:PH domain-containing protein n=1 Tax=Mycolicibacterium sp. TaxID=2320850 RepID=UPI0025DE1EFB|nr:PH domain-containing protein [Mycolicibacterium sp.]HPX37019.1 PH domain-containing protein [Mycobacterium sp.]HQC77202.1 PH domain-containing protein [Mycobacterium sp.]
MDNRAWGPRSAAVLAVGAAGILMAVAAATVAGDAPGRLLGGIAAIGLLIFAAGSWRARPRLAVNGDSLVYRGWFRTRTLRPADIESIRITEFRRIGRKVRLLEIDTGEQLIVLTRWDLGTDPLTVLDGLTAAGIAGNK